MEEASQQNSRTFGETEKRVDISRLESGRNRHFFQPYDVRCQLSKKGPGEGAASSIFVRGGKATRAGPDAGDWKSKLTPHHLAMFGEIVMQVPKAA
ncbi:hypothetical protein TNCV_2654321 [Trichonephila clavipes]|nr:hypothetical protein TNCV_2654321 [Trichonephila clavipes]